MKRSEPKNLFDLENLEQRILLSADSVLGGLPGAGPVQSDPLFDLVPALPPAQEVLLAEDTQLQESSTYDSEPYDPFQQVEDIFSGLTEEDLSSDGEETPSEPTYVNHLITPGQQTEMTRGLKQLARLGGVLADVFFRREISSVGR